MDLYGSLVANEGGGGGTADVPIKSISVNGSGVVPVNNNVNIDVPTKTSELENDSNFITESNLTAKDYADKTYVGEQIAQSEHLKRKIVDVLPTSEEANEQTIYMIKVESAKGDDKYKEYMLIDGVVQCVGDTSVELTDYAKIADVNEELSKKVDGESIVIEVSDSSTDEEIPSAKSVYNIASKLSDELEEQFVSTNGKFVTVVGSKEGKVFDLEIQGNTHQNRYTGKNLLKYPYTSTTSVNSGVTFTDNGDGSVSINGQNTTDQWVYFWFFGSSASDEIKRENLYGKQLIISGLKNDVGNIKLESYYKTTDNKEYWIRPTDDNDYFTITYPSKSEVAAMNLAIVIYPNGVVNNVTVKPMIRLATETDSSYEPYVGGIPAPNPSYPQEIKSVGEDSNVMFLYSLGKNVLYNEASAKVESSGITFEKKSDNSIEATGTQTGHAYYLMNNDLKVDLKGKYILSGNTTENADEWGYCLLLQLELEDGSLRYIFNNNPDEVVCDFSLYPTLKYVRPYIRIGQNADPLTDKVIKFYPMLRPYGTSNEFKKCNRGSIYISLNNEPLRSCDKVLLSKSGSKYIYRYSKEVVLDGSDDENWVLNNELGNNIFTTSIVDLSKRALDNNRPKDFFLCTHYIYGNEDEIKNSDYLFTSGNYFSFKNKDISSLEEWKSLLSSNPIKVYYVYNLKSEKITNNIYYLKVEDEAATFYTSSSTDHYKNQLECSDIRLKCPVTDAAGLISSLIVDVINLNKNKVDKSDTENVDKKTVDINRDDIDICSVKYLVKNGVCSISLTNLTTSVHGVLRVCNYVFPGPLLDGSLYPVVEYEGENKGKVIGNACLSNGFLYIDISSKAVKAYATLTYLVR